MVEALHANLSGACLRHAHIKNGRWYWTSMAGADLSHVRFEEVWLEGVDFSAGNLTAVHLDRCEVKRCAFRQARLADTHSFRTRFEATDLADSDARGAQFHDCSFAGARLTRARFENAEFIDCSHLAFDHNRIADTRLSATRPEAWQHLRRRYTVARLGAHLLLLLVAFLPAISRVNGLVALEAGRQVATAALQDIETTFAGAAEAELGQLQQFSAELRARLEPGGHPSTTRPLYYILLGFDRDYLFAATALLLLLYNLMRLWLTWNVSVLRDEGARTGRTPYLTLRAAEAAHRGEDERVAAGIAAAGAGHLPPREELPPLIRWLRYHHEAYGWMLGPDRLVRPFFWLAVAGVTFTLLRFLLQPIAIPGLG